MAKKNKRDKITIAELEREQEGDGWRLNLYRIPLPDRKLVLAILAVVAALVLVWIGVDSEIIKLLIGVLVPGTPP